MSIEAFNISLLILYFIIAATIAWHSKKFSAKSLEDYATGYYSVSTPVLIAGFLSSCIGAGTIIGSTSKLYYIGLFYAVTLVLRPISWWIAAKIFPSNISKLKSQGCLSISHVIHYLYGNNARLVTTVLTLLTEVGIIAAQMIAISYALSNLLFMPSNIAPIFSFLMIMGFSLMGGIRTIAQTGMFQFSLFFLLFPISYLIIAHQYGGFQGLNKILPVATWGISGEKIQSSTIIYLVFSALMPECSSSFIQKCLIARNKKQLESSLKLVGQTYIPIMLSLCLIAYTVKVVSPEIDPDQTLLYYINSMCPFWLQGLLSISVIAIIMGMSDGILHSTSVIFANDIVKVLIPKTSERGLIVWARSSIIVLSCISFLLINYSGNILDIIWTMHSIWAPIVFIPLCAGFAGFVSDKSSFAASSCTAGFTIAICYYLDFSSTAVFVIGIFASSIGFFSAHIFFRNNSSSQVLANYINPLKAWLFALKNQFKTSVIRVKARIIKDLFPEEEHMLLGQKLIYNKFCVAMVILFFIYSMLMDKGDYYKIMGVLLGAGYVVATLLMLRDVTFNNTSKKFYLLWYGLLLMWSTISSYALIGSGSLMTSVAALSLLTLIVFTNAITYLFSIAFGLALSLLIYALGVGGAIGSQFYLVAMICLLVGFFFLRPQEEIVKDRVADQQMMLGTMAHEMTSPQAAAEMSMEMVVNILGDGIRKDLKDDKVSLTFDKESLSMLEIFAANALKSTKSGIKTVQTLLMVSKTDKVKLPKEIFNVNECAQKAIQEYTAANKSAIGKITLDIADTWQLNGPKDLVGHVNHNHVKNSFVHGGRKPDLHVKVYKEGDTLIIEDNGIGIPAQYLPFIFDRFFTKSSSGTGIGLALSKMVVESMGGTITCESQTGEGSYTHFIITLPNIPQDLLINDKELTSTIAKA